MVKFRTVKFVEEVKRPDNVVVPSMDLVHFDSLSVAETSKDKNGTVKVTFEMREGMQPGYGVYLGYEGGATVPEVVVDEYGYYVLVFNRNTNY